MGFSKEQIIDVDSQHTLHKAIISTYINMEKYRRFKVGCEVSDCDISDLLYLSDIICANKCHITKKDKKIILERIQGYGY